MSDLNGDYRAEGKAAVFAFRSEGGKVTECAPYGRSWLVGQDTEEALARLTKHGFTVTRIDDD